jgi:tetratricopeptide (TPR) repeat protein
MSPEAKIHYDKSMQLLKEMRAVQTDPEKVKKLNDENIQELKKAAELDPKNAEIWYQLGNAYTWVSSTGTLEDGLHAYKKAEEIDPNNVIYINGVGDMLIQMGKYEEAILQFQKTLRLTDKSGFANLSVAHAYAKLGIKDSAKEHYQKAIDIFTSQNATGSYDEQILQARKGIAEVSK